MSKQKLELSRPVEPDLLLPEHASAYPTFGRDVVLQEEGMVQDILDQDYAQQLQPYAAQLETKIQPERGRLAYTLGKVVGKSTTDDEQAFLNSYKANKGSIERQANGGDMVVEFGRDWQKGLLDNARTTLRGLDVNKRKEFETYCAESLPRFFLDVARSKHKGVDAAGNLVPKDTSEKPGSWHQWFSKQASDEQLTNFLQWHVDMLDRQQSSPETARLIAQDKVKHKEGVKRGLVHGQFHPEAAAALSGVDDITVVIGDTFDTLMNGWGGYHIPGTKQVIVAQGHGHEWEPATYLRTI